MPTKGIGERITERIADGGGAAPAEATLLTLTLENDDLRLTRRKMEHQIEVHTLYSHLVLSHDHHKSIHAIR
jgi:hypothetical protein